MLETADIPKDDEGGEQRDRGGDEVWIQGRVTRNESDSDSGHKKQRETSSTGREWVQAGPYRRYASDKSEIEKEVTLPARHDDLRCLAWSRPRAPGVAAAGIPTGVYDELSTGVGAVGFGVTCGGPPYDGPCGPQG